MATKGISRRAFVTTIGVAGAVVAGGCGTARSATAASRDEFRGMLVDTTRCIGCRTCEAACAEFKGLPAPDLSPARTEATRTTSSTALTVVNRRTTRSGYAFLKNQCMHCNQPACASACLTKALVKNERGQVTWNGDKCMGCRMCMVSCPFDVPKFEYSSANPEIVKCDLCFDRTKDDRNPACVEACPAKALTFGTRRALLTTARERIAREPDRYIDHIYGEHEAGGTGVLYLASLDFDELGMKSVGKEPYPQLTKPFLSAVPLVLAIAPVFMLALHRAARKDNLPDSEEERS